MQRATSRGRRATKTAIMANVSPRLRARVTLRRGRATAFSPIMKGVYAGLKTSVARLLWPAQLGRYRFNLGVPSAPRQFLCIFYKSKFKQA